MRTGLPFTPPQPRPRTPPRPPRPDGVVGRRDQTVPAPGRRRSAPVTPHPGPLDPLPRGIHLRLSLLQDLRPGLQIPLARASRCSINPSTDGIAPSSIHNKPSAACPYPKAIMPRTRRSPCVIAGIGVDDQLPVLDRQKAGRRD